MSGEFVRLEIADGVAVVTIDNPPVNALTNEILESLGDTATLLAADSDVRVVVLTGAGEKAFMAGADLSKLIPVLGELAWIEEHTGITRRVLTAWAKLPQPVIAAVGGSAIGGGLEVALVCDLIVADPRAKFGCPEVKLGLIPGAGGTQRLPRRIPPNIARQLLLFGDLINAEEAHRLGLVNTIAEPGQTLFEAHRQAAALANLPAIAVQGIKAATATVDELDAGLDLERSHFFSAFLSTDAHEGVNAFFERRTPQYLHR